MREGCYPERRLVEDCCCPAVKDASIGNGHAALAREWVHSHYAGHLFNAVGIAQEQAFLPGLGL